MPRGGKRPGAGRPRTKLRPDAPVTIPVGALAPADYLLSVIADDAAETKDRLTAAKALLPYCYRKPADQPAATAQQSASDPLAALLATTPAEPLRH